MALPVSEQIAVIVRTRLAAISTGSGYETTASEVVRPTRISDASPKDYQIIVFKRRNPQVNIYPAATPKIERRLEIEIRAILRPSELDTTAIDTLVDTFAADVTKALTSPTNWRTFGGLAVNAIADVEAEYDLDAEGSSGHMTSVLHVIYRHPEDDPYTVAA